MVVRRVEEVALDSGAADCGEDAVEDVAVLYEPDIGGRRRLDDRHLYHLVGEPVGDSPRHDDATDVGAKLL